MIGFQINGEFLDLPENPSVELNRNSPIFQQEGFVLEDYTLPITFPNTPKNSRILGWPHIVENAQRTRAKWDCILFYNGVPRLKGELRAKSPINHRNISANFVRGISQIGEDVKERSLREIVDDLITVHNQNFQKSFTLDYYTGGQNNKYAIIVNGKSYEGEDMAGLLAAINDDEEKTFTATSPQTNRLVITNNGLSELDPISIEEFTYPMEEERRGEGSPMRRAAWEFVEVPQWSIDYGNLIQSWVNDYIGNDPQPFRLGTIYNRSREQDIPQVNAPVVNFIDEAGIRKNIIQAGNFDLFGEVFAGSSIAPYVTLDHVLSKIEEYYHIKIEASFRNEFDNEPLVLLHPNTIDVPQPFLIPYGFESRSRRGSTDNKESYKPANLYNFYRREFSLSEFVPDMTVNDLLKALQSYFNTDLSFDNDSRTLTYTNRKQYVQQREYIDITDRCEPFSNIDNPMLSGVKLIIPRMQSDKLDLTVLDVTADPYQSYDMAEAERPIEMPVNILPTVDFTGFDSVFNSMSVPKEVCAMDIEAEEKFPLIIGIAQSHKSNPLLPDYNLCRIVSLSPLQNLTWYGPNNSFDKNWRDWILLEDNRTSITNQWLMTREEAFNLTWGQRWRIDRTDYLLQSFNVALRRNGLSMAECQFVKVPFFREIEVPNFTLAWRGVESSKYCVREWIGWKVSANTGEAAYNYLEEYVVETDQPTGKVKENKESDPDYIAPVENLGMCPLDSDGSNTGFLYFEVTPHIGDGDQSRITINGVTYLFPNNVGNAVSNPHQLAMVNNTVTVVLSNTSQEMHSWNIKCYKGEQLTKQIWVTIHPGNKVRHRDYDVNDPRARTFSFTESEGAIDRNFSNKLVITRSIV